MKSRRTLTPMEDLVHGAICDLLRLKAALKKLERIELREAA